MMRALLLATLALASSQLAAADDPMSVIEGKTERLATMIDNKREQYLEDERAFKRDVRSVLLPTIDTVYSARLVLGRHGRGKEREQIEAFADALAGQLLDRYATALLDYDLHDRIEFLPLAGDNTERATRVRTRVRLDNGSRAPVDYVMRLTEEGWKVFDVIVEGISYVATFRSQIDQEIRRSSFENVLGRLQSRQFQLDVDD